MESTGTAPARVLTVGANENSRREGSAPQPAIPASVAAGAQWFFWIVGLTGMDSVLTGLGSHVHRFTGLGITALVSRLAAHSGSDAALHLIVNGWMAIGFLFLGYCALEGRKWAFALGMAVYTADAAMLAAAGDYLSVAFHAIILAAIFRGFAALRRLVSSEPSNAASAAHAG
jgi:hypothetical protein